MGEPFWVAYAGGVVGNEEYSVLIVYGDDNIGIIFPYSLLANPKP